MQVSTHMTDRTTRHGLFRSLLVGSVLSLLLGTGCSPGHVSSGHDDDEAEEPSDLSEQNTLLSCGTVDCPPGFICVEGVCWAYEDEAPEAQEDDGQQQSVEEEQSDEPTDPMLCEYRSTTYEDDAKLLDASRGSATRIRFRVVDVPDPSLFAHLSMVYDSWDADHPGEEGFFWINGHGPLPIPANDADGEGGPNSIVVTPYVVAGVNKIKFGPGIRDRNVFAVGRLALEGQTLSGSCPD